MKLFSREKCIYIFSNHTDFFTNPTLLYLAEILDQSNYRIVIYNNISNKNRAALNFKNIRFYPFPSIYPNKPRRPLLYLKAVLWPKLIVNYLNFIFQTQAVIGVDLIGYIVAAQSSIYQPKKTHYISFELLFKSEMTNKKNSNFMRLKILEESFLNLGINSLLIQDLYRNALFQNENQNVIVSKTYLIPVAPKRNLCFKQKSVKNVGKKIKLVYAGSVYEWSGLNAIIDSFIRMNHPLYELHIHSRFKLDKNHPLSNRIFRLNREGIQIYFHSNNLDYQELCQFLCNFDIGIATYFPVSAPSVYDGLNLEEIGLSSGKFSTYMMLGLPTIVSPSKSFKNLRESYDFGEIITDFSQLSSAINKIVMDYQKFSSDSIKLYEEQLNPDLFINSYIENLLS